MTKLDGLVTQIVNSRELLFKERVAEELAFRSYQGGLPKLQKDADGLVATLTDRQRYALQKLVLQRGKEMNEYHSEPIDNIWVIDFIRAIRKGNIYTSLWAIFYIMRVFQLLGNLKELLEIKRRLLNG